MIFRVKSWGREEREVCVIGALSLWGLWQSVALRARGRGPSRLWCWRSPEANRRCCSQGCSAIMPTLWSWTPVKVAPNGIWACMCCLISWLSSWWILCFPFENSSKEYTSSECLGWGRVERTEEILRHDHFCPWIPGPAMGLTSYSMDDSYMGKNCPSQISLLFMGRPWKIDILMSKLLTIFL